jgi:hypothetical protein
MWQGSSPAWRLPRAQHNHSGTLDPPRPRHLGDQQAEMAMMTVSSSRTLTLLHSFPSAGTVPETVTVLLYLQSLNLHARFVTAVMSTADHSHILTPTQKISTSDFNFNPRYFVLYFIIICLLIQFQQDRQCTYNVTMRCVSVAIVAVEKL